MNRVLIRVTHFVLIVAMLMPLFGCAAINSTKSKEITLTTENVYDYLEITVIKKNSKKYSSDTYCDYLFFDVEVVANPHFKYNNVKLSFEGNLFSGKSDVETKTCEFWVTLNLSGKVKSKYGDYSMPVPYNFAYGVREDPKRSAFVSLIGVSGTVESY